MQGVGRLFPALTALLPLKPVSPWPIPQSDCFVNTLAHIAQANAPELVVPAATIWTTLLGLHYP